MLIFLNDQYLHLISIKVQHRLKSVVNPCRGSSPTMLELTAHFCLGSIKKESNPPLWGDTADITTPIRTY